MWGPYGRNPYGRSSSAGAIYIEVLESTYRMVSSVSASLFYVLSLAGSYILNSALGSMYLKLVDLVSSYLLQSSIKKQISFRFLGVYRYVGSLSRIVSLNRNYSVTYVYLSSLSVRLDFLRTLSANYVKTAFLATGVLKVMKSTYAYVATTYDKVVAKGVYGSYKVVGSIRRFVSYTIVASYRLIGHLVREGLLYKFYSTTYAVSGNLFKQVNAMLLSSMVYVASRLRLQNVVGWEFTGDFKPEDRIKVDSDRMVVTLNGNICMDLVDGDLPFFNKGPAVLTYSDAEGSRTVKIRVSWRGRWL